MAVQPGRTERTLVSGEEKSQERPCQLKNWNYPKNIWSKPIWKGAVSFLVMCVYVSNHDLELVKFPAVTHLITGHLFPLSQHRHQRAGRTSMQGSASTTPHSKQLFQSELNYYLHNKVTSPNYIRSGKLHWKTHRAPFLTLAATQPHLSFSNSLICNRGVKKYHCLEVPPYELQD